jgi:hypothetical protein
LSFRRRLILLWLLAGLAPALQADEAKSAPVKPPEAKAVPAPAPSADDEFLEFLGSVDADAADEDWLDYLAQTDISKVAKAKKQAPDAEVKK